MVGSYHRRHAETNGGRWSLDVLCTIYKLKQAFQDLNSNAKLPDARRSARKTAHGYDLSRDPYMLWTNRRAVNSS